MLVGVICDHTVFSYLPFIFILDINGNGRAECRGLSLVHAKESQPLVTVSVLVGLQHCAFLTLLVLRMRKIDSVTIQDRFGQKVTDVGQEDKEQRDAHHTVQDGDLAARGGLGCNVAVTCQ
ncbi:hypothetical protein E2C01_010562 [Portunus trituberculatus]|uniref:Uncharacterized protein n=1 Tax=Portunus trituberculatus TaxID=210409 RepID=A0A5B7D8Q1_PORTR|nr:hypothetical protein [Portunus trituberculatus]